MNHLGYSAIIHPSPNRSANSAAIRHPRQCATREAGDYYGRMRQALGSGHSGVWKRGMAVSWSKVKKQENRGNFCDSESQKFLAPAREAIRASRDVARLPWFFFSFTSTPACSQNQLPAAPISVCPKAGHSAVSQSAPLFIPQIRLLLSP